MELDIKAKATELAEKLKSDPELMKKFKENPIKTVEGIIGIDLPDEQIKAVAEGIKGKLVADTIMGGLGGKLFGGNNENK